jgi:hypothetical protein
MWKGHGTCWVQVTLKEVPNVDLVTLTYIEKRCALQAPENFGRASVTLQLSNDFVPFQVNQVTVVVFRPSLYKNYVVSTI